MKNEKSILNNLPRAMPAFSLAKTLSKRASSMGFDWNDNEVFSVCPIDDTLDSP